MFSLGLITEVANWDWLSHNSAVNKGRQLPCSATHGAVPPAIKALDNLLVPACIQHMLSTCSSMNFRERPFFTLLVALFSGSKRRVLCLSFVQSQSVWLFC